jgi:hypothetical protein
MPSRKQRRRRAKEKRHEWEYIEIDPETGEERPVEVATLKTEKNDKTPKKPAGRAPGRRPLRPVPPPSWQRTARRAAPWAALLVVLMLFLGKDAPVGVRIVYGLLYGAFLFPFLYWMDRMAYRMYLRRSGQAPPPRGANEK